MRWRFGQIVWSVVAVCGVLALVGPAAAQPADFIGHKVVRVEIETQEQLDLLLGISPDIWNDTVGLFPLDARIPPDRWADLEKSGLRYKVLIEDVQALIDRERVPAGRGTWDAYMNLDQIVAYLNNLAAAHPNLCEVIDIGNSIQNRDLWVLHITGTNPDPKPAVFYHGLQHAREWISGPVVLYLADYLVTHYGVDPCVTDLVNRTHFYLAPCVNPDGYVHSWNTYRLWRKNRRLNADGSYGVDLNRNWALGWGGGGSSGTPSSDTYRGTAPFSEPETQALRDFIITHPNIRAYMDYHSYSQLILWPYGYANVLPPEPDRTTFNNLGLAMQALILSQHSVFYDQGPIYSTIYQASGGSVDWVYGDQGRFGFTIELRDTGTYGFQLPPEQILPTCEENLPAILHLSEWASAGLLIELPNGVPSHVLQGTATPIAVRITNAQETYVAGTGKLRYRFDPAQPFSEAVLSPQSSNLYTATLPAAPCGVTIEYYIVATGSGGFVATSPCQAPTLLHSTQVVHEIPGPQLVYSWPLDTNPGWTTAGQWAFGQPTGGGSYNHDPTSGYTGTKVYGYNLNGDYTNNLPATYLTTAPIDCSGLSGVQLKFRRWLGVESNNSYDEATVEVSNGGSWTVVWRATGTGGAVSDSSWQLQTFDISAIADHQANVRVRWGMGPTDASVTYPGWNIDDIEIWGIPPGTDCTGIALGDVNFDSAVNGRDIAAFVAVLLDPGAASAAERCAADIDGVCGVALEDVPLFIELLLTP